MQDNEQKTIWKPWMIVFLLFFGMFMVTSVFFMVKRNQGATHRGAGTGENVQRR